MKRKSIVAVALAVALTTACWTAAQWLSVALADLPILTQMALNIATLSGGGVVDQQDQATINNISKEVAYDLSAISTAYNEYKDAPSAATLQKIEAAITATQNNLPALLQAAHIKDTLLTQRVSAAVGLVLTTAESFAQLLPQPTPVAGAKRKATKPVKILKPTELRQKWQENVGVALK